MSAPDVSYASTPDPSILSSAVGNSTPTMPQYDPSQENQTSDDLSGSQSPAGGGSRLQAILGAVAKAAGPGIAGAANQRGRGSFVGGMAGGAGAELQQQAQQQDIKFKDFDNQLRAANLHNQDLELQMRTQEQQDAHQKAQDFQSDWDDDHGIEHDPHPNDGDAVMQTLKAQTAASGAASIPAGTHLSADGKTINVPDNSPETQAGQLQKYQALQGVLPGLPTLPRGATFVPPKYLDILTHVMGGYDVSGAPVGHDKLPDALTALQTQRDALGKKGATPYQLGTLDNLIGIYRSNLSALDDHAASVVQKNAAAKAQGTADVANDPDNVQGAATKAAAVAQAQSDVKANAAKANGGSDWLPKVGAD
jgi:hypothetical protein